MKVLVCGGRDFNDPEWLSLVLNELHRTFEITMIIHGGARGADTLGGYWAEQNKVPYLTVPADWALHGRAAGYVRNAKMLEYEPDRVVAFPGGSGTKMMCDLARKEGVYVQEVFQEEPQS